jgi:hypothetical protein
VKSSIGNLSIKYFTKGLYGYSKNTMLSKIRRFLRHARTKRRGEPPIVSTSALTKSAQHDLILEDEENPFIKTIQIAITRPDGGEELVHARAILDTQCPYNLMSRDIANLAKLKFDQERKTPELRGLGGGEFISAGTAHGRFRFVGLHHTLQGDPLKYEPKFYATDFKVSEHVEHFDVLIGVKTIRQYDLVKLDSDLPPALPAAPTYRPAPSNQSASGEQRPEKCAPGSTC